MAKKVQPKAQRKWVLDMRQPIAATGEGVFAGAHYLKGYKGPCKEMHGHTWRVALTVASAPGLMENLSELLNTRTEYKGIFIDFKDLKGVLRRELDFLDHTLLNHWPGFTAQKPGTKRKTPLNPTAENLALALLERCGEAVTRIVPPCFEILKVTVCVWESETAAVRVSGLFRLQSNLGGAIVMPCSEQE